MQARGWLRVRRLGFYETTPKCRRELVAVAGPDAMTAIPATARADREAAHAAARDMLLPLQEQRDRMPSVLALLGRHATNPTGDGEHDEITAGRFASLLALAQNHGLTVAEAADLQTALRNEDDDAVDELAVQACAAIPPEEFLKVLGPAMSRLVTHRVNDRMH